MSSLISSIFESKQKFLLDDISKDMSPEIFKLFAKFFNVLEAGNLNFIVNFLL